MKRFVFAVLCSMSLAACAQTADPQAGRKIAVGAATTPAGGATAPATYPAGSTEARVRDALRGLAPDIAIERIEPAPFQGFHQVIAGGQVVYVSDDGKHLLQGSLLDLVNRKDLSEAAMEPVRRDILAKLPLEDRIVFKATGAPRHTVVVLTDVECGYCRKFHNDIAEYNRRGIEVEYMAFPRAGLGSPDYRKMVAVWCAPDRARALTAAKNDRPVAMASCARTPVDMQYRAGKRMGLQGTPMILTADGKSVGGYLPPEELLKRLDEMEPRGA
ncbi:MAG: DsbC family protein [Lysobacteraceae bacterium]|nr:MAG: DsbC family protein [Xanthomonadaceae bacterium]